MRTNNRITYRFDHKGQTVLAKSEKTDKPEIRSSLAGNERSQVEKDMNLAGHKKAISKNAGQPSKSNVVPIHHSGSINMMKDINPWNNSVFDDDIGALEELIRETGQKNENERDGAVFQKPAKESDEREKFIGRQSQVKGEGSDSIGPKFEKKNRGYMEWDPYVDRDRHTDSMMDHNRDARSESDEAGNSVYERYGGTTAFTRKAAGPSWFKVFLSVAGALATGALFGYLLLSLFMGAKLWPGSGEGMNDATPVIGGVSQAPDNNPSLSLDDVAALPITGLNQEDVTASGGGAALPGSGNEAAHERTIGLTGLDQSYYMLQFGVFSNTEGRDTAINQLKSKGFASAAMKTGDTYRVYAGIAGNKAQAATIAAQLGDVELYAKEVEVKSPSKLPFQGDTAIAQDFFEQTKSLITMWDDLVVTQLEQPSLSPLGQAAAEAWQKEYQQWKKSAAEMQTAIKDTPGEVYGSQMIEAVKAAAASMLDYDKNASKAHLWSIQAALMQSVLTQKEWFETSSSL